jgi:hypothetical protein
MRTQAPLVAAVLLAMDVGVRGQGCVTAPAEPMDEPFNIQIVTIGDDAGLTSDFADQFAEAATIVESFFASGLPDVTLDDLYADMARTMEWVAGQLGSSSYPNQWGAEWLAELELAIENDGTIDDLLLYTNVTSIDGEGGAIAQAYPGHYFLGTQQGLGLREEGAGLPYLAYIEVDVDDIPYLVESGGLMDTIVHEMIHGLGFGTIQKWHDCTICYTGEDIPENSGLEYGLYICEHAVREHHKAGFSGYLFVEGAALGPGSACGHWREDSFTHEQMSSTSNPTSTARGKVLEEDHFTSRITLAALEDIGYDVDYSAAERYNPGNVRSRNLLKNERKSAIADIV